MAGLPDEMLRALVELAIARPHEVVDAVPLQGGVSSDIWRVRLPGRTVCVKRALAKLRVDQAWSAPTRRHHKEAAWMAEAATIVPGAVPSLLGHHQATGLIVMDYLPPDRYAVWKHELRDGRVDPDATDAIARLLATIHARTARSDRLRETFLDPALFRALRLDPYFSASAQVHTDLAGPLGALTQMFESHELSLVHGDFSPKNILVGPDGPVILDAECANFGDPAFDLAFCLNHLLLKSVWNRAATAQFERAFMIFCATYRRGIDWEPAADLEARAAQYLAGLMLARIDGKSPVEYITRPADRETVRAFARMRLLQPANTPAEFASDWFAAASAPDREARR